MPRFHDISEKFPCDRFPVYVLLVFREESEQPPNRYTRIVSRVSCRTWPNSPFSLQVPKSQASVSHALTMTSPSRPVNITSPRLVARDAEGIPGSFTGTPIGTPDLRALRAQYAAASTPPPNIPPRNATPIGTPRNVSSSLLPSSDSSPIARLGSGGVGGISARRPSTPASNNDANVVDIEQLPDEEKAKVLRRHLVSREERQAVPDSDTPELVMPTPSVTFAQGSSSGPTREDSEPFPVPYDAPGADVT